MASKFAVKLVKIDAGEDMPLLIHLDTGLGVFEPTSYALTMRSAGSQVNTIAQALRAVQFLYETLAEEGVDLIVRARANDSLELGEVEALVARCKFAKADLLKADEQSCSGNVVPIRSALKKRRAAHYGLSTVQSETTAMRLHYIGAYLKWFANYAYLRKIPTKRGTFRTVANLVIDAIKVRTPPARSHERKKGITKQQEKRLLAVLKPDSPENPWPDAFVRTRNYLIVRLLLDLGLRKGELLGLKINDINFSDNTIRIARRPDDPEDPRRRKPQAKTSARILSMSNGLADLLKAYLSEHRFGRGDARRRPFVFVSEGGAPLALNSVDSFFSAIRQSFPELSPISAHLLRHTWNDRFSELVHGTMKEPEEKQLRNYLMGWSHKSKMAANYTGRYVEEKAREMSLKLQNTTYRGNA